MLTVGHETPKIHKLGQSILFAASGPVGLGQHLANMFLTNAAAISSVNYFDALLQIQVHVRNILIPALVTAGQAQGLLGSAAQADALCGSLVAAVFKDGLKLVEISPQGGFEHLTHDVPYVCLGSGKANADPFIKFLWSVYWPKGRRPSVPDAVLTAYWTVKATIDARTSGVGYSPDVAVISENATGGHDVKVYSSDELLEHDDFIEQAHQALRSARDRIVDRSEAPSESIEHDPLPTLDAEE